MKPEAYAKEIEQAAQKLGLGRRELFDAIIAMSCAYIALKGHEMTDLYSEVRCQQFMAEAPKLQVQPDICQAEYFATVVQLKLALIEVMKAGSPFEDRLTAVYSDYLVGVAGQYMSPDNLGHLLARMVRLKGQEDAFSFSEPTCGTGSLALGFVADAFQRGGKIEVGKVDVSINDIDIRLVRIALFQLAFYSIEHCTPLASLTAFCTDIIRKPVSAPIFYMRKA